MKVKSKHELAWIKLRRWLGLFCSDGTSFTPDDIKEQMTKILRAAKKEIETGKQQPIKAWDD